MLTLRQKLAFVYVGVGGRGHSSHQLLPVNLGG